MVIYYLFLFLFASSNGQDSRKNLKIINDCIYLYTNGGQVTISYTEGKEEKAKRVSGSFNLTTDGMDTSGSECPTGSGGGVLSLKWKDNDNSDFNSIKLTLILANDTLRGYWYSPNATVEIENKNLKAPETMVDMYSDVISSVSTFSFSCSNLELNSVLNTSTTVKINLNRFQLQPFDTNNTSGKFSFADSFDCSTWFTIPLWMGFIVILLFTIIIGAGIGLLADIKTMDRFENPKGKMIAVPTGD